MYIKEKINFIFNGGEVNDKERLDMINNIIENISLKDFKSKEVISEDKIFYFGKIEDIIVEEDNLLYALINMEDNTDILKYWNLNNIELNVVSSCIEDKESGNISLIFDKAFIRDTSDYSKLKPLSYHPTDSDISLNIYCNGNILPDGWFACRSGKEPNRENLRPIDRQHFEACLWDFKIEAYNKFDSSNEWSTGYEVNIFRNRKRFHREYRKTLQSAALFALEYIRKCSGDHPLDINEADWKEKNIGRKVWWNQQPAIVTEILDDKITLKADYEDGSKFKDIPSWGDDNDILFDDEDREYVLISIFDDAIDWFRD